MGYVIVAGVGLALGIGLMIWALSERSKRHAAERKADEEKTKADSTRQLAARNAAVAQNLEMQHTRLKEELQILRTALQKTQKRLAKTGDPKAVAAWLDDELKGGPV